MNRRSTFAQLLAVLFFSIACLAPRAAAAQSAEDKAKERFSRGVERMDKEDYAGAAAEFEEAYKLAPYAVILFNLGVAYQKLDRPVDAVATLKKVVADPGSLKPERVERAKQIIGEEEKKIGKLSIEVNQPGAVVRIDGDEVGQSPLPGPKELRAGTHYVEVLKAGYAPVRQEAKVSGQAEAKMQIELAPTDQAFAQLWIKTELPDCEVWLDGGRIGTTPLSQSVPVLPGKHSVELRRVGYETAVGNVDLGPGSTGEMKLTPQTDEEAIRAEGGFLILEADQPENLVLTINGKRHGVYAGPIALAPGKHEVRVEEGGFLPTTLEVSIEKGGRTTTGVVLEPTPETIADHNASVALFRGFGWTLTALGVAAIGGGVGFTVWNEGRISDREDAYFPLLEAGQLCDSTNPDFDRPKCEQLGTDVDNARAARPAGYALLAGGGAFLVTGVILLIVGPDADKYQPAESMDELALAPFVAPSPEGVYAGVHGAF